MDQVVVDLADEPALAGEIVTIFGPGDAGEPTVADWAGWAGTIGHEIVARIGDRVRRSLHAGSSAGRP
jgi:alanine racemase